MYKITLPLLALVFFMSGCDNKTSSQKSNVTAERVSEETLMSIAQSKEGALGPIKEADHRLMDAVNVIMAEMIAKCPEELDGFNTVAQALTEVLMSRNEVVDRVQMFNDHMVNGIAQGAENKNLSKDIDGFRAEMETIPFKQSVQALYESMSVSGIEHPSIEEVLGNRPTEGGEQAGEPTPVEAPTPE